MKIHAFRLTRGMDLKKSIEDYVVEKILDQELYYLL